MVGYLHLATKGKDRAVAAGGPLVLGLFAAIANCFQSRLILGEEITQPSNGKDQFDKALNIFLKQLPPDTQLLCYIRGIEATPDFASRATHLQRSLLSICTLLHPLLLPYTPATRSNKWLPLH
jgi:hypothetical protein